MKKQTSALGLAIFACATFLVGCSHGGDDTAVDKPLMQNAPAPPPRPDKPTVSPNGASAAPQGAASTP